jgi:hypothetical protein
MNFLQSRRIQALQNGHTKRKEGLFDSSLRSGDECQVRIVEIPTAKGLDIGIVKPFQNDTRQFTGRAF